MGKYTKKKAKNEFLTNIELFQDPLISSVMFQLASFEWGLKQRELLEILNKTKDNNRGKGVRWALKQLSHHKLIETSRPIGHTIQIKNNKNGHLEKAVIGKTESFAKRIQFKHNPVKNAPIEYLFDTFEKKTFEHGKSTSPLVKTALQQIKLEILKLHTLQVELFSLNPTLAISNFQPHEATEKEMQSFQQDIDNCSDPIKKQEFQKTLNQLKLNQKQTTQIEQAILESFNQHIKLRKEENKDFIKKQRDGRFTYSEWLITKLEHVILFKIYEKIRSQGAHDGKLVNLKDKHGVPITSEEKTIIRRFMEMCIKIILELDKTKKDDILLTWLRKEIIEILNIPFTKDELEIKKGRIKIQNLPHLGIRANLRPLERSQAADTIKVVKSSSDIVPSTGNPTL